MREAFRSLEAQGFVTFRPPDEVVVSKPTREEIEDAYAIAGVLEGLAARLGVERAQPEEIEHLRELHQAIKDAANKHDLIRYFDANSNFHRFIAEIARNERLYRLIVQLRQELKKTRILALQAPQRLRLLHARARPDSRRLFEEEPGARREHDGASLNQSDGGAA